MGVLPKTLARYSGILKISITVVLLINSLLLPIVLANFDPYRILGVRKDASQDQIKKAYRDLARRLHPDKSNIIGEERFIELNKAFDILKDPSRRSRYDQHGETEENRHSRGYHPSSRYQYHNRQDRGDWAHMNGFHTFTFTSSSSLNQLRKRAITSRQFYNEYIKESFRRPYLVFVYRNLCLSCSMIEGTFMKLVDEMSKVNVGFFSINYDHEQRLSQGLNVKSVPHLACLIDGQIHQYYSSEKISLSSLVKFIKNLLPYNLVTDLITETDQERFVAYSPTQNKLCAIIYSNQKNLKLRYLILANEFKQYYRFGHISSESPSSEKFAKLFKLNPEAGTHILIFGEDMRSPIRRINLGSNDFDYNRIRTQFSKWPFLKLPRLSSQSMFDDLCRYTIPKDGEKTARRLCVILLSASEISRLKMISFMEKFDLQRDPQVVFAHIDPIKQGDFIRELISESSDLSSHLLNVSVESSIVMLERHPDNNRKAHYKWLSHRWNHNDQDEFERATADLHHYVFGYKQGSFIPRSRMVLSQLIDEYQPSLISRLLWRIMNYLTRSYYYFRSTESISAILILFGCACLTSMFLYKSPTFLQASGDIFSQANGRHSDYFVPHSSSYHATKIDASDRQTESFQKPGTHNNGGPTERIWLSSNELKLIELKAETYNGLVRLLKPGHRSILILVDNESQDSLLKDFRRIVWPYRKNKTLLFGFLSLDKNIEWYETLLGQVLSVEGLRLNKRKCIGTVLSLNGYKRYLRVYHTKHHEIDVYSDQTNNDGSFLGFDDEDQDGDDIETGNRTMTDSRLATDMCPVDHLLDKLPIWLDKMFDGLTKRYFVDDWPEVIN